MPSESSPEQATTLAATAIDMRMLKVDLSQSMISYSEQVILLIDQAVSLRR
jgi:hypothetical protein